MAVRYLFALSAKIDDRRDYKLPPEFLGMFTNIDDLGEYPGRLTKGERERRYLADKGVSADALNAFHMAELDSAAERDGFHLRLFGLCDTSTGSIEG